MELKGGERYLDLAVLQQPSGQTDGWTRTVSPLRPRVHRKVNPFTVCCYINETWAHVQFNSKASDTVLKLPNDIDGPLLVSIFTQSLYGFLSSLQF